MLLRLHPVASIARHNALVASTLIVLILVWLFEARRSLKERTFISQPQKRDGQRVSSPAVRIFLRLSDGDWRRPIEGRDRSRFGGRCAGAARSRPRGR